MAMLAEKRRRVKWCLNPNGKVWSSDGNKFGQRMLEKMGWKEGEGLGKQLQGMKAHIRISSKSDNRGLGFKGNEDCSYHQNGLDDVLAGLAASYGTPAINVQDSSDMISLEQRSKDSRARLHYKKFTRGKDLSRYSTKDLACILGKDIVTKNEQIKSVTNITNEDVTELTIGECSEKVSVKYKRSKEHFDSDCVNNLQIKDSDDVSQSNKKARKSKHKNVDEQLEENEIENLKCATQSQDFLSLYVSDASDSKETQDTDNVEVNVDMLTQKKRKAKRKKDQSVEHCSSAVADFSERESSEQTVGNDVLVKDKTKKRKRNKTNQSDGAAEESLQNDDNSTLDSATVLYCEENIPQIGEEDTVRKSKKKKRKTEKHEINEECNLENEVAESPSSKKKKRHLIIVSVESEGNNVKMQCNDLKEQCGAISEKEIKAEIKIAKKLKSEISNGRDNVYERIISTSENTKYEFSSQSPDKTVESFYSYIPKRIMKANPEDIRLQSFKGANLKTIKGYAV